MQSAYVILAGDLRTNRADQTATLVFDGTRFAKLTVNGVTYTIDLGPLFGWHGAGPIAYSR